MIRDISLIKRIAVAIVFAPLIFWIFLVRGVPLFVFLLIITVIGQWELFRMFGKRLGPAHRSVAYAAGLTLLTAAFFDLSSMFAGIIIAAVMAAFIIEIAAGTDDRFGRVTMTLFASVYPAAFTAYFLRIEAIPTFFLSAYIRYLFVFILVVIWVFDTASYFAGRMFGRHPFFPKTSPKKTVEGFVGGLAAATLAGGAIGWYLNPLLVGNFLVLSVIIALAGQAGDLSESIIKRELGVKDSSNIIPGHGGILDRFDSLFFAAPAVYCYLFVIRCLTEGCW